MNMKDCPFCSDLVNERVVAESECVRVILSNPRLTKGHLLVIPKRHVEMPWELTNQEVSEIFDHIKILQKRLSEVFGTGCDVRQNYRPFLKQGRLKVDHIHYHLIPRRFKDELYEKTLKYEVDIFTDITKKEAEEVRRLIK
jgi:diadenosine tetraphosphate (Ap4A) HIT family hydrolase